MSWLPVANIHGIARRARLDHREPARPDPRVVVVPAAAVGRGLGVLCRGRLGPVRAVGVDDRLDVALGLRVAQVAGQQVEPGRGAVGQVAHLGDLPDHRRWSCSPGASAGLVGVARRRSEPLFHMPQSDSGSSDGSRSRDGPGMPSSAKAVKVNGSATLPGAVMNVASDGRADLAGRWRTGTGSGTGCPAAGRSCARARRTGRR